MMLVKPLRPLGTALAVWKGIKGGAEAYRRLGPGGARGTRNRARSSRQRKAIAQDPGGFGP